MIPASRWFLATFFVLAVWSPNAARLAAQQASDTTPSGSPLVMRLCVSDHCHKLVWRGSYYDGIADNGVIEAHYTVDQWSTSGVRFQGKTIAPVGQTPIQLPFGLPPPVKKVYAEGVFTGPIAADGHSIENGVDSWKAGSQHGELTFTLTWEPAKSALAATPACSEGTSNLPRPAELEVCDGACILNSNGDLGAWTFNGNKGSGNWVYGDRAVLTVQEWANGKVGISRDDPPGSARPGLSAVYTGSICGETIKGTVVAHWPGHWGDKDITVPWTATIPTATGCENIPDDPVPLVQAAQQLALFRHPIPAFKCLSRAADLGDMNARTAVGLMYRDAIGITPASYTDALRMLKQSAIQGDYNAQRALSGLYEIGPDGKHPDLAEAKHWEEVAYNNPVAKAERDRRAAEGRAQEFMFLGLSAIVEAMAGR